MKKVAAVFVSLGVILVIVGLVLVGIYGRDQIKDGGIFSFGSISLSSADCGIERRADEVVDLKEINVNVSAYAVFILESDTDVVSVKHPALEDGVYVTSSFDNDNGVLTVTQTDNYSHNFWGFNWFNNRRFIVIYLPQTEQFTQAKLSIKAKAGSINISEVAFAAVDVETDAGSVKIDNLTADTMSVSTSAGSINVGDVNTQSVKLSTKAGSINFDDVEAQSVTLSSNAGSIKAENVDCATFDASADAGTIKAIGIEAATSTEIKVSAGSVRCEVDTPNLSISSKAGSIKFITNASAIKLSSKTGSVNGTIEGVMSEYQIDVRKDTGSSNISNQNVPGATKHLSVEVNTGSIHIDFDND